MLDNINVFLDTQCIVSQEDFQHKILNWSTVFPLFSLHTSSVGKRGQEPKGNSKLKSCQDILPKTKNK